MAGSSENRHRSQERPLRADARRNGERVLKAARETFAEIGFEASYHEIARRGGVGVGTVYRRYPDRAALLETVLLDIIDGLSARAEGGLLEPDAWAAFADFFTYLSGEVGRHAGLSQWVGGSERVDTARRRLLAGLEALRRCAGEAGLRADIKLEDVLFLAQAAASTGCGFGVDVQAHHRRSAVRVMLNGLRAAPKGGEG